jgi:hypothetical protein
MRVVIENKELRVTPATVEPVYLENTLLRVFGVLFCHDPKRARHRTGTITIDKGVKEKTIAIRLDPEYAQPGPFAHKVAMAVIRKQSSFGRPAKKEIAFSQRELMRLTGRKSWGGRQSEQLALALKQIRYTHVIAHFKREDRLIETDFSIFNEIILERRSSPHDPIVACTIVLADPIIQSLNDKHFTCINHTLMQQLGTIGQALYIRLFFHFSTHYDGHHVDRVTFKKRYDDICAEWLGGLAVLNHRSKIVGEQLGTHLDQLVRIGFLASYKIAPAEGREGFVLTFRPGRAFVSDYSRFYSAAGRAGRQAEFTFRDEVRDVESHRVAYLFIEKSTGLKPGANAYVSSRDVETAKELLALIPIGDIASFLDYAFAEAQKTRFQLQNLGGVRQYLNAFLASRQPRHQSPSSNAVLAAQERTAQARAQYDRYRSRQAQAVFNGLSDDERAEIEALAASRALPGGRTDSSLSNTLIRIERARIVAERHPTQIDSFEHWSAQQAA